jgi:hypothetical protein
LKKALAAASAAAIATTTLGAVSLPSASAHSLPAPVEQTEGIKWFGRTAHVRAHNPNEAVVKVRYKCEGMGFHLWASLKQGPGVRHYEPIPERPYPPADVARAWYETPEGVVPTCDGTYNTLRYTVSRVTEGTETHPEAWGKLRRGKAFAQFVVFSFPEGANPETDEPNREAFAGVVRVAKHHHRHH